MIDVTTFTLHAGVDLDAFRRADARMQQEFAYQQPGLLRRTVAAADDGGWVAIELWSSAADADAATGRRAGDAAASAFDSLVDPTTVIRRRYRELDG